MHPCLESADLGGFAVPFGVNPICESKRRRLRCNLPSRAIELCVDLSPERILSLVRILCHRAHC